ncbi:unnamed protein product [Mytilus edulis]|uniref:Uncharacterized protein n=1 Tax=Mytilus edulis TaxID=6550 RepID=A0A8S3RNQ2_MYTED|nr:unnamed protein product [Mytilus edulis]
MDIKIEENEDFSVENDNKTSISNSRDSAKNNCMQEQDQDEEHASSFKNKTTESPLEECNTEMADSGVEQIEINAVQWLHGNIKTRYNDNHGFQHIFMFDSKTTQTLLIRNGDQLLSINDDDVTVLPNKDVVELLEKILLKTNTTMTYWRPSTNSVTVLKFCLFLSGEIIRARFIDASTTPVGPDWTKNQFRVVVFNKTGTNLFMQHLESQRNSIVFKELSSGEPGKKACDFVESRFLEDRRIESNGMYAFYIRRYSTIFKNKEKKYLHVPDDGTLDLVDEISKSSKFELIPDLLYAFLVMKERSTNRCMKLEGDEGTFVGVNYKPIRNIGDEFRFQLSRCREQCNLKLSTKKCVII